MTGRPSPILRVLAIAFLGFTIGACAQKQPEQTTAEVKVLDPATLEFVAVSPDSLRTVIAAGGGSKGTLVNVWASWCEPCREEFPGIVRLARAYEQHGLRVVFVSADFTEDLPNARKYLAEQGVDWPTFYKIGDDQAFIASLDPKWTGALPGSFVYDAQGVLRDSWEGKATYATFEKRVRPVLSLPALADTTSTPGETHS